MNTRPNSTSLLQRLGALLVVATLFFAACGSDDDAPVSADDAPTDAPADESMDDDMGEMADDEMADDEMADDEMAGDMMGANGPACSAVPTEGDGSFAGMADDTAATAASANPLLSTLVEAVVAADLVDTLNSEGPFTVFAPTNDAFAAIPEADLEAVLADEDLLTSVLTLHVIAGEQLSSGDLVAAGSAATVNGADLTFEAAGDQVMVNGTATTICQDVPTANATVHIIDSVLLP